MDEVICGEGGEGFSDGRQLRWVIRDLQSGGEGEEWMKESIESTIPNGDKGKEAQSQGTGQEDEGEEMEGNSGFEITGLTLLKQFMKQVIAEIAD